MEALKQTIEIPVNHKLTIDIPDYVKEKYAEIIIIFKDKDGSGKLEETDKKFFISDKVKSVSGIINSDKDYKDLRDEIVEERMSKYESLL